MMKPQEVEVAIPDDWYSAEEYGLPQDWRTRQKYRPSGQLSGRVFKCGPYGKIMQPKEVEETLGYAPLTQASGKAKSPEAGDGACDTDTEVSNLESCTGPTHHGYALHKCRNGFWVAVPEDVVSVDLRMLSKRIQRSGLAAPCEDGADKDRRSFTASCGANLTVYASGGKLLVRCSLKEPAEKYASELVDNWLNEEDRASNSSSSSGSSDDDLL